MPSSEFANLKGEIEQLRASLADFIHPLGEYDEPQKRRTLAFVVLAHACIEHYLESRCREVMKAARESMMTSKLHMSTPSLLAFSGRGDLKQPTPPSEKNLEAWKKSHDLATRIAAAIDTHEKVISSNNGIKEANVVAMVLPLGIPYTSLDQTLLAELESFGDDRGYAAHVANRVFRDAMDTGTEVKRINQLVALLESLDAEFDKVLPTPPAIGAVP